MDPRFIATPTETDIAQALKLWPELAVRRIRPVLVTAFGVICVETETGEVLAADPIDLLCEQVAESRQELELLVSDREWSEAFLLTDIALLAHDKGVTREQEQIFSISPHPCFSGEINVTNLMAMDLHVWHSLCVKMRESQQGSVPSGA